MKILLVSIVIALKFAMKKITQMDCYFISKKKKKTLKFTGECCLLNSCKFIFYLLEKASLDQFLAEQQRQEGVFAVVGGVDLGQIPLHSAQVSCRIALKKNTSKCFPISQDRYLSSGVSR